jgi:hypothetical protein
MLTDLIIDSRSVEKVRVHGEEARRKSRAKVKLEEGSYASKLGVAANMFRRKTFNSLSFYWTVCRSLITDYLHTIRSMSPGKKYNLASFRSPVRP